MWPSCVPGTEMGFMWIVPLLLFVVMMGTMIVIWRRGVRPGCGTSGDHQHETSRQILDRRYAAGELSKDQYDDMRRIVA